jgi:threonine/homoserine/homoserine lactone efflux protein
VSSVAFAFAFLGSLPLAGPIAILVVADGVSGRYKEALLIAFGAAIAEGTYAFLAFWGFSTFLARHALVLPISHGVTAVLLCALGTHFLFFKLKEKEASSDEETKPGRFWFGFSIAALNPTLLATWGAVMTFLCSRQLVHFTGVLAVPFGMFAAAGIAAWGLMVVWLLKRFRNQLPRAALAWVVRSMGVVLIGVGVRSGIELGRYVLHPKSLPKSSLARVGRPSRG